MASTSGQPADLEAQSREHTPEQEKQPQTIPQPQDSSEQVRQHELPPLPLPPSHQKVRFNEGAQYAPPPQQYGQYPQTQAVAYPYSRRWYIAKLVLYNLSILTCVIMLGLGIYLAMSPTWSGLAEFAFISAAAGGALLWTALEFLITCASRQQPARGIHPGGHVAVHLIIWLYCAVVVAFISIFISEHDDSYTSYYYSRYYDIDISDSALATAFAVEQALLAFSAILLLLHFILFVRACVETNQYNRTPRTTTIYVPVPLNGNGAIPGPQEYYAPGPNMTTVPPQVARQLAASGHMPVSGQEALVRGYYAPPGPAPGTWGQHPVQANNTALHGYYAPPPSAQYGQAAPQRGSLRHSTPSGSAAVPSPSTGTVSPIQGTTPHNPPTAPSPVSAS